MVEKTKKSLFIILFLMIFYGIAWVLLFLYGYQFRLVECPPEELIPALERVFDVNFPEVIKKVKTAKTPSRDGSTNYVVRFIAESDVVDKFLDSVPKRSYEVVIPYSLKDDGRKKHSLWFPPSWFTVPIQKGKKLSYSPGIGEMEFYIDTSDTQAYIVYIYGHYADGLNR